MLERMAALRGLVHHPEEDDEPADRGFPALRYLSAHLLLAAGAEAALGTGGRSPAAARWAAALTLPAAATAQVVHATHPSPTTTTATRLLNAAVLGLGFAGLVGSAYDDTPGRPARLLSSLVIGSAGALGILLERQERLEEDERRRLARRAAVVERLVPRRRAQLDRIVVHV